MFVLVLGDRAWTLIIAISLDARDRCWSGPYSSSYPEEPLPSSASRNSNDPRAPSRPTTSEGPLRGGPSVRPSAATTGGDRRSPYPGHVEPGW